ncbi:hypothetical protein VU677_22755, partial [Hafnia paralvei]|uniref:hypothetical protein n=1 Tax=Hafnia paralvei TaxID=546367 RepID=UPI00300C7F4C
MSMQLIIDIINMLRANRIVHKTIKIIQNSNSKKAPCFRMRLFRLFNAWQFPTLAWGDPTLPSALRRFTSE